MNDDGDGLLPSRSNDAKGVNYFKHDDDPATGDNFDEIPDPKKEEQTWEQQEPPDKVETQYDDAQLQKLGIKTKVVKDKDGNERYVVDESSAGFVKKEDPGATAGGDKVPAADPNDPASGTPASGTPGSGTPPTPHGGGG